MEPIVIWDLDDDSDGNVQHVAEHGISKEEVESVLHDPGSTDDLSESTGRPMTFGWTSTDRYIAVVWEPVADDPRSVYPISAYEVPMPRRKKGRKK